LDYFNNPEDNLEDKALSEDQRLTSIAKTAKDIFLDDFEVSETFRNRGHATHENLRILKMNKENENIDEEDVAHEIAPSIILQKMLHVKDGNQENNVFLHD
jgi:hypothetical protein